MRKEEVRVRFCPKCRSMKVKYIQGISNLLGLVPRQRCLKCGFESSVFPILVVDKKDLRRDKNGSRISQRTRIGKEGGGVKK